jgi:hypothetical protein
VDLMMEAISERSCEYLVHDHVRDPAEIGISVQSTQQHPRRAEEETRGGRALRLEADLIAHLPNMGIIRRNQAQSGAIKGHPTQSQYRLAEWLASLSGHPSRHTDSTQATRLGADDRDGARTAGLYGVVQDELRHLPN